MTSDYQGRRGSDNRQCQGRWYAPRDDDDDSHLMDWASCVNLGRYLCLQSPKCCFKGTVFVGMGCDLGSYLRTCLSMRGRKEPGMVWGRYGLALGPSHGAGVLVCATQSQRDPSLAGGKSQKGKSALTRPQSQCDPRRSKGKSQKGKSYDGKGKLAKEQQKGQGQHQGKGPGHVDRGPREAAPCTATWWDAQHVVNHGFMKKEVVRLRAVALSAICHEIMIHVCK